MHSFVYTFWTENNTSNPSYTHTHIQFELTVYKKMRDFGVYHWIFRHIYSPNVAQRRCAHNCYFGKWIFIFVISRFVQLLPSKIIHEIRLHFTNFQFSWLNSKQNEQNIQCEMCSHCTKNKLSVLASLVRDIIFLGGLTHTFLQFSSLISLLGISRLSRTIN